MRLVRSALLALAALLSLAVQPALADTVGAVQPGNTAAQSDLQGCLYETSPAVATSGQQRAVHCDANGNLAVTLSGGAGTQAVNLSQVSGVAVGTGVAGQVPAAVDNVADGAVVTSSVSSATTLFKVSTTGYGYALLQFTSAGSGNQFIIESANDGVPGSGATFLPTTYGFPVSATSAPAAGTVATNTGQIYAIPISGSTLQVRISSYTSGTVTANLVLKRASYPYPSINPQNTTVLSKVFAPQSALGVGSLTNPAESVNGNTFVEEGGRSFANITTATTTTVKSGLGFLHTLTINSYVASATITLFDNTAASGTKIGTITLPSTVTSSGPVTINYDIAFATGLTIVTSGATDLTVSYR